MFKSKSITTLICLLLLGFVASEAHVKSKGDKGKDSKVQRTPTGFFDFQPNTVSNIETVISNYGMIGYDRPRGRGSGYWPRNSRNQYIFGGGIWFAARKFTPDPQNPDSLIYRKLVSISYDPSTADSWQTPGRIEDESIRVQNNTQYRVYFSTDFSPNTGQPFNPDDGPAWPVWDTSDNPEDTLSYNRYFGNYVYNTEDRTSDVYSRGPAYISGEDIFSTYHDLDLAQYSGSIIEKRRRGYPLGLQFEFTIYSWGFGDYKDFFFCKYEVMNMSEDTLFDCWLAPIMDVDLARDPFLFSGASNDRVSYNFQDTSLNLAYQWTDGQFGEQGQGFGYLGFDFLESPIVIEPPLLDENGDTLFTDQIERIVYDDRGNAIDTIFKYEVDVTHPDYGFVIEEEARCDTDDQLGLVTFRNWSIENDIDSDDDVGKYDFLSTGILEGDTGPGDKRYMMTTGPFNLRPNDTSRTVVGIVIANTSKGGDPDGTPEDIQELLRKDRFAQEVYCNNFRAPGPPDLSVITDWQGLKNSVRIQWDSTAEMSEDNIEGGLDFLGYRIERARRDDLDTFSIDQINSGTDQYPRGTGPLGWKTIADFQMPRPFVKSSYVVGDPNNPNDPLIDSMQVVGPVFDEQGDITDSLALRVMRVGQGVTMHRRDYVQLQTGRYEPAVAGIDTLAGPWAKDLKALADEDFSTSDFNSLQARYQPAFSRTLFDEALVGIARFDRARIPYNPIYFDNFTFEVSRSYIEDVLDTTVTNGLAVRYVLEESVVTDEDGNPVDTVLVESSIVDSVYFVNTLRTLKTDSGERTVVDGAIPIDNFRNAMRDSERVIRAEDSLYSYIQQGLIEFEFPDYEGSLRARTDIIVPYMDDITNGREFIDIGDDNRDGQFNLENDPIYTEKIINNIPYYYRIIAYDEGDYNLPTPRKSNNGVLGQPNVAETFAEASPAGERLNFEIIEMDTNLLGGLYDFEFFAIDEDRALQLFAGDTLELTFEPQWSLVNSTFTTRDSREERVIETGLYVRETTLKNLSEGGDTLFFQNIVFSDVGCNPARFNLLYENASYIVGTNEPRYDTTSSGRVDSTFFGVWDNKGISTRTGEYFTGDFSQRNFCNVNNVRPPAYGTLGFRFKFGLQQLGGRYRPDSIYVEQGDATTYMSYIDNRSDEVVPNLVHTIQPVDTEYGGQFYGQNQQGNGFEIRTFDVPVYNSFNNGPVDATVEFVGSGTDTITLEWNYNRSDPTEANNQNEVKVSTFTVPYLDLRVTNNYTYEFDDRFGNPRTVSNSVNMEHLSIDPANQTEIQLLQGQTINRSKYPDPRNIPEMENGDIDDFVTQYNIAAFAHVDVDNIPDNFLNRPRTVGRPFYNPELRFEPQTYSGLQGRYYLTGTNDEGVEVDFINVLNISGAQFVFDAKNVHRRFSSPTTFWPEAPDGYEKGEDFEEGDVVRVKTFGGAAGLPYPGASVKVRVSGGSANPENITDANMDDIKVVPNPYYISHIAEKTPYTNFLYFTKVPPGSQINIYTAHGQLVKSSVHNGTLTETEDGRVAVNVWDLLMNNGLRVQSQTLVAHIIAPNGAETLQKFSVVVGQFNISD